MVLFCFHKIFFIKTNCSHGACLHTMHQMSIFAVACKWLINVVWSCIFCVVRLVKDKYGKNNILLNLSVAQYCIIYWSYDITTDFKIVSNCCWWFMPGSESSIKTLWFILKICRLKIRHLSGWSQWQWLLISESMMHGGGLYN